MHYLSQIDARRASRAFTTRGSTRGAISLIEVLISMFVLLFGLMGVAAIFPVGNHYVVEGEKFDLASGIAQNAFEELKARGVLRPEVWVYPFNGEFTPRVTPFIVPSSQAGPPKKTFGYFNLPHTSAINDEIYDSGPGHAFVIDPMGAISSLNYVDPTNLGTGVDLFPIGASQAPLNGANPWFNTTPANGPNFLGERWPVRRLTLPIPDPTATYTPFSMTLPVAETIFRLRDDLAVDQPDESDQPSLQRWDTADIDPTTGNANNTPDDPSDDVLLRRQYKGDYSWLATIVPTTAKGLEALQPANADYGEISCDVSIVVFRKREVTPSAVSERLIYAELLQGGELILYDNLVTGNFVASDALPNTGVVDDAVEDVRSGNWISLMGVNQTTGAFVMKWYRMLSLDDETGFVNIPSRGTGLNGIGRRAMLIGPEWPATPNLVNPAIPLPAINLRAGILPGVISVVTKPLKMEDFSLWKLQ